MANKDYLVKKYQHHINVVINDKQIAKLVKQKRTISETIRSLIDTL